MKTELQSLEKAYQDFLASFDGTRRFILNGRRWKLRTLAGLCEQTTIDRITLPFYLALAACVPTLRGFFGGVGVNDQSGGIFDFGRLSVGFCIGEEEGDFLFIDKDTGAVYCWHHDGGDVERLVESFLEFSQKCGVVNVVPNRRIGCKIFFPR